VAGDIDQQLVKLSQVRRAKPGLPCFEAGEQIRGHSFELITEPDRAGSPRALCGDCKRIHMRVLFRGRT
jgi:uncharacterized CHY-type Zn-finger protein